MARYLFLLQETFFYNLYSDSENKLKNIYCRLYSKNDNYTSHFQQSINDKSTSA